MQQWLVDELDDITARLKVQVLFQVPEDRRRERPGGGNSILWACFHGARHADLALSILTGAPLLLPAGGYPDGGGLEENEQPWSGELAPEAVDSYLTDVMAASRRYLAEVKPDDLDQVPDTGAALARNGIPTDNYDWLYRMWTGQPAAFLVRWPLMGHLGNHMGEMVATRNRMGLSAF